MAEAAEKFRREMDAMREQLKEPASEVGTGYLIVRGDCFHKIVCVTL